MKPIVTDEFRAPVLSGAGSGPTRVETVSKFSSQRIVTPAWRECVLTRVAELASLLARLCQQDADLRCDPLATAVTDHLEAARAAVIRPYHVWSSRNGSILERAMSNLDAAEASLLRLSPPEYLIGQIPSALNHVQRHLPPRDPRRQQIERLARALQLNDQPHLRTPSGSTPTGISEGERGMIVAAVRAASSAALGEQRRVRSFRNVLIVTAAVMTLMAMGVAIVGFLNPEAIPLCFQPEKSGQMVVVCPTGQSLLMSTPAAGPEIDAAMKKTAGHGDLFLVEAIGMAAATVAAAVALRGIRGSSESFGLPVALALLKLPMGAMTAFLGLVLMRGQFLPGLTALDTSAQILAWALVFGYAQQLFTRMVDRQAHTVLNAVRGADAGKEAHP